MQLSSSPYGCRYEARISPAVALAAFWAAAMSGMLEVSFHPADDHRRRINVAFCLQDAAPSECDQHD